MRHTTMGSRRLYKRVDATDVAYIRSITQVGTLRARTTQHYRIMSWSFNRLRLAQRDWMHNFSEMSKKGKTPKKGG